tara:strand:- start:1337 stop:1891 length:555 start_codon:yes stop_codon:yes gene_type:complete
MKNFITILALTLIMSTGLMSCAALEGFFGEGTVFTTSDQLLEGEVGAIIPFDQLPDSVKAKIPEGTSLVMASKEQLKVDAAFVPAGGEIDGEAVGGIIDSVFGIATAFIPGLAAWEGIVTLFSTRKRKHYANAVKAIVPTDKKVDIGGALGSVMSALGVSHSSPDTAAAFEEEGWEYEEEENVI